MLRAVPTGYVRLVGQEPTPSKCVLLSTSRVVRKDMKDWVLFQEGTDGLLGLMSGILVVIWIPPFGVGYHLSGLVCNFREFVWFLLVWF